MRTDYQIVILLIVFAAGLSLIIAVASYVLSDKTPDKEKVSVYECGFDPFHSPGKPFSIRFFLIAILFLVFDLEISYLFPWSCCSNIISLQGQLVVLMFLIILTLGLVYEWIKGGLEWE